MTTFQLLPPQADGCACTDVESEDSNSPESEDEDDDSASGSRPPGQPKPMTTRQAVLASMVDSSHVSLGMFSSVMAPTRHCIDFPSLQGKAEAVKRRSSTNLNLRYGGRKRRESGKILQRRNWRMRRYVFIIGFR